MKLNAKDARKQATEYERIFQVLQDAKAKELASKHAKQAKELMKECEGAIKTAISKGRLTCEVSIKVDWDGEIPPSYIQTSVVAELNELGYAVTKCYQGEDGYSWYCLNIDWSKA